MKLLGITDNMVHKLAQLDAVIAPETNWEEQSQQRNSLLSEIARLFNEMSSIPEHLVQTLTEEAQQLFHSALAAMQQVIESEEDPDLMQFNPRDDDSYEQGLSPEERGRPTMPPPPMPGS